VQLLIGPQSSAEVEHLKPFVDANGLLLVSPSSTAGSLAIVGDNVFRFTPSDSLEGVAISAMMWDDGVRAVVPVWRDDPGNAGLGRATRASFSARGGAVLEGVKYDPAVSDFTATIARLQAELRPAIEQHGAGKVAVYLAAFDEVAALFASASSDPLLASVRWYGSDGVAHSAALLNNHQAAKFAIRVGFPNPVFGLEEGARDVWAPLATRVRARVNLEPDAFALAVYDAVWVVARGYVASGATVGIEQLKLAFTTAASTHFGATGWTVLNAAGDRKYGDFDFWAVRDVGGVLRWSRVAQYETRTGRGVR
jgi:branched-chain amino acid transport system substrate-binding protein